MRGRIKKVLCCLMALFMVLAMCPLSSRAADPIPVNDEASLRQAITTAQGGEVIKINSYIELQSVGDIVITKNITLEFSSSTGIVCNNPALSVALIIRGCEVTITGDGYVCGYNNNPAISVETDSGASLVINGGTFKNFDPTAYLGDNCEVADFYRDDEFSGEPYTDYVIRSAIVSPEFAKLLTDGKLVISSAVKPNTEEEAYTLGAAAVADYLTDDVDIQADPIGGPSAGKYDVYIYDNESGTSEVHRVEANYIGSVDPQVLSKAKSSAANLTYNNGAACFEIRDLEVINMWASGFNPDAVSSVFLNRMVNYSGQLKEYLGNSNLDFRVVAVNAGDDSDLYTESYGESVVSSNGVICAVPEGLVTGLARHVIYVPTGTATTKESLMSAAQNRINDYLGNSTKVVFSEGGTFTSLTAPEHWQYDAVSLGYSADDAGYRQHMLDKLGVTSAPADYFVATVNGHQFKLLIIPDSTKMVTPKYETKDIVSNVTITSDAAEIPLDTSIRAAKLTSGATYDNIIDKLKVDKELTYDLKLYSGSNDKYISKLEDDSFKVSVPLTDDLKGLDLSAYYIDDAGNIEEHPVEVVNNEAQFETDHFSIYTIAKASPNVCSVNGKAHKLTAVPAKAATTTAEGNKAYWTCDCGKWFADADGTTEITDKSSVIIPKLKETVVNDGDKDTTTEAENTKNSTGSPATGDTTNVILLFCMLLVSAVSLLVVKRRD